MLVIMVWKYDKTYYQGQKMSEILTIGFELR